MKKLVIFDLDGTLLNTLEDLAIAGNYALKQSGLPVHPTEAFKQFVGNGVYKLVERMTPENLRADERLLAKLKADFDFWYGAHGEANTAPYDGVIELLDRLAEMGVARAVLSNKPHEFAVPLCQKYFGDRFTVVFGQRQGYPCKPDRMLTAEILEKTGVSPEDAIYVGDSGVDMQTAKNGDLFAVGALWGFRSRAELEENGADAVAERPLDLLNEIG